MLQFAVGDKAVYPGQGVAEVIGTDEKTIGGAVMHFYTLRIMAMGKPTTVMVPVDKAGEVGLRPIIAQEELPTLMEVIGEPAPTIDKQTWNRRYRGFMEKVKAGSIYELAEVFRDLMILRRGKTLSFGERRMLDTTRHLLVGELSVAQGKKEELVQRELERIFTPRQRAA